MVIIQGTACKISDNLSSGSSQWSMVRFEYLVVSIEMLVEY